MPRIARQTFITAASTIDGRRVFTAGSTVPDDVAARVGDLVTDDDPADDTTCPVCDRTFKSPHGLSIHAATHDDDGG